MERTIRRKKPWALAAASLLLGAFCLSAVSQARVYNSVSEETFGDGHKEVKKLVSAVSANQKAYDDEIARHNKVKQDGDELTGALKRREFWAEIYKAINECQPRDMTAAQRDETNPSKKNRLKVTSITAEKFDKLKDWWKETEETIGEDDGMLAVDFEKGPEGVGYVFTVVGTHYRDERFAETADLTNSDRAFIRNQFIANFQKWAIERDGKMIPIRKLGITHCYLDDAVHQKIDYDPNTTFSSGRKASKFNRSGRSLAGPGGMSSGLGSGASGLGEDGPARKPPSGGSTGAAPPPSMGNLGVDKSKLDIDRIEVSKLDEWQFRIKFVWTPTPVEERQETDPASSEAKAKSGKGDKKK